MYMKENLMAFYSIEFFKINNYVTYVNAISENSILESIKLRCLILYYYYYLLALKENI